MNDLPVHCPNHKCKGILVFEDHSLIGGDSNYWICPECGQEKVMFGRANRERQE